MNLSLRDGKMWKDRQEEKEHEFNPKLITRRVNGAILTREISLYWAIGQVTWN